MMQPKFFVYFSLVMLLSCGNPEEKSDSHLTDEQLATLMFDMHLSDAVLSGLRAENKDSISEVIWLKMTDIYGLSKEELEREVVNLQSDPVKVKVIYERVRQMIDSIQ